MDSLVSGRIKSALEKQVKGLLGEFAGRKTATGTEPIHSSEMLADFMVPPN